MSVSAIAKINTPDITTSADLAAIFLATGKSIEPSLTPRFSSPATRDAAFTSAVFTADAFGGEGLRCWMQGVGSLVRSGGAWKSDPQPIQYDASPIGGTLTNAGDATGITSGFTVAAKTYPQVVQCSWAGYVSGGGNATDIYEVGLRRDGNVIRAARGNSTATLAASASFYLPANTSTGLQVLATKTYGSTAASFTSNGALTYLTAVAIPAGVA